MSPYSIYLLKLFPVNMEARELYTTHFGGESKKFENNENAGVDLLLAETEVYTNESKIRLMKLGVRAVLVNTFTNDTIHFWLAPRSSIWKTGVVLANSMGVIDRTYRGELMAACMNYTTNNELFLQKGTRIVQVVAPDMGHIVEVRICNDNELDATLRGEGGFGSTGGLV
jgi:deoxyuridine 5'-triphosphate nucleotidohydrolase